MKSIYFYCLIFLGISSIANAQSVSGRVIDADIKEPIVGASVTVENSTKKTITDLNGNFKIELPQGRYTLSIKFDGYESQQISVRILASTDEKLADIAMKESAISTDDIAVAVGSRATVARNKNETTAPIDVVTSKDLQAYGQLDLNQALNFLLPSFNSNRQSGSDISDHIDPSTVRGLGPDQVLVLVNGKRYHQSALINVFGTRGRGNTVTDFNSIPVAAIERIEILRDGAAAQYGSDAIAGVINIVLKTNPAEFTGGVNSGVYSAGDGLMLNPYVNYGIKIGDGGYINLTAELLSKAQTLRPADASFGAVPRNNFGDAQYSNKSLYLNAELPINNSTKFYTFGGYNQRSTDAQGFTYDADSERNVKSIFPNGFDPIIKTNITDLSISVGIKKRTSSGWDIDFNNTFGQNQIKIQVDKTLNSSLGAKSPTFFEAGSYQLSQNTTGINFTRKLDVMAGLNLAFGSEFRIDSYKIVDGDEASWKTYTNVPGQPGGSQNYPGIRPENATNQSRNNLGIYTDIELDVNKSWLVAGAVRFENYSDFGSTFNIKLASRYKVASNLALRGSFSTGFRAPSLAQSFFSSTINDVLGAGIFIEKVISRNNSPLTQAVGIPQLTQETSLNGSLGFAYQPSSHFSFSVDGYWVDVKNRIVLTGAFFETDPQLKRIFNDLGVVAAQFFANTLNTTNYGVDIVGTLTNEFDGNHSLTTTAAFNFNSMDLGNVKTSGVLAGKEESFVGKRDKSAVLAAGLRSKGNIAFDYKFNKFFANLRFNYFGGLELVNYNDETNYYDARLTTDVSLGYSLSKSLKFSMGVSNLFNSFPTKQNPEYTETGGMYEAVQMGFGGMFGFARLRVSL
jgi:iron complex outermembrane recepter protein